MKEKRVLYHINRRPARPQPKMNPALEWDRNAIDPDTGERTGDMVPIPGTDNWIRYWLDSPVKSGVFLTPNPVDIAMYHGRSGNVYAYKVPEWVIDRSGGIHRYDNGSELLIPEDIWNEAGDEIEFIGKSMDRKELMEQIDDSSYGRGFTRRPKFNLSLLSDEQRAAWEKQQKAFNLSGLRATQHPEDVIKMLTLDEQTRAIEALELAANESKPYTLNPRGLNSKDEDLLDLLKKHLKLARKNTEEHKHSAAEKMMDISKELISIANELDKKGLFKEADFIDGVITRVHGKGPEEPVGLELGDFTNLDDTNITKDEAFDAGHAVCENSLELKEEEQTEDEEDNA